MFLRLVMQVLTDENKTIKSTLIESSSLGVLSEDRLKILIRLSKEPSYCAAIAKELKMQVQTVYYHVGLLEKAGLVKLIDLEAKSGAMAKKYAATSDALTVILNSSNAKPLRLQKDKEPPLLFKDFIDGGVLNAHIVIGSPDPHGKYRSRGSELCVSEFSMLLGSYCSFNFPLYYLDTEVNDKIKKEHLILIGGPKVNTLVAEINGKLPIKFDETTFDLYSTLSRKRYGENVGIIELIDSPFAKNKKILLIGGLNHIGTRAAVLALLTKMKYVEKGNAFDANTLARVIEGFDENGDSIVDQTEILE